MKFVQIEQRTDEWLALRAGKVTGSAVTNVMAQIKSGEAAARRDYRIQIVTEILTGQPTERGYVSKDMEWGTLQEPNARAAYEVATQSFVAELGFCLHPEIERAGCSPDGLVEWDGLTSPEGIVQFKCPKSATHVGYILAGTVPSDYRYQMTWEMICTGAKWCDFVSFDPRMPEPMQLFVVRYHRDEAMVKLLNDSVALFLGEVDETIAALKARCA
jgi:putative phage-type endonuclease